MKILIENEYVKSWTDPEAPIIFSRVLKEVESSILIQQFCDLHEGFITYVAAQKRGAVYSICDTYVMQPFMFEILLNYYIHAFPKHQRAGLTFKAFVKPRNFDKVGDSLVLNKVGQRPISFYESFDQAFYHVKNDWRQMQAGLNMKSA